MKSNPVQSQSGAAIILAILVVAATLGLLFHAGQLALDRLNAQVSRQRDRIIALQVLQDFAVLAQRANNAFEHNGGCPANHTRIPAAKPFCWPNDPDGSCVRHPDPGLATLCRSNAAQVSISKAESNKSMDLIVNVHPKPPSKWELIKFGAREVANYVMPAFQSSAQAQNTAHLPPLGGAPTTTNITAPACAGMTVDCKRCDNTASLASCLVIRVCIRGGCGAITSGRWYIQQIGMLAR